MEPNYTVQSKLDGWQIDVYGNIDRARAQKIADRYGVSLDYITLEIIDELEREGR